MTPSNSTSIFIALAKYGVGSIIALYAFYLGAQYLPILSGKIDTVDARVETVNVKVEGMQAQHQMIIDQSKANNETIKQLLRGICLGVQPNKSSQQLYCNF